MPDELAQAIRPPLCVGRQQDFGVRIGPKVHAFSLKLLAQLDVIVQLAVENDVVAAVGGGHRLPGVVA